MSGPSLPSHHPSLPRAPTTGYNYQSSGYQALQQPYPGPSTSYTALPAYTSYYGSHYAQAYYGQAAVIPSQGGHYPPQAPAQNPSRARTVPTHLMSSWYQGGNNRCSHPGCTFTGSRKTVEIHMMDRHLIYPPGWNKRKKSDWDADPSLKGKTIPIQGTNVILDTPEVIDAWIAERKKRFPTSDRVEEKKRKMDEAIARGQLDLSSRPNKRQKFGDQGGGHDGNGSGARRGRGGRQQRGRGSRIVDQQKRPDTSLPQKPREEPVVLPAQPKDEQVAVTINAPPEMSKADSVCDGSSDEDGAPEELSSKHPEEMAKLDRGSVVSVQEPMKPVKKQRGPIQPRPPPKNPFAARPALLRSLLLPDIRMTVSNLSQAIRFIVDNDFLRNVELKPGQAAEQHKIHVMDSQETGS